MFSCFGDMDKGFYLMKKTNRDSRSGVVRDLMFTKLVAYVCIVYWTYFYWWCI